MFTFVSIVTVRINRLRRATLRHSIQNIVL